ncbi:Cytochrome c-type biogenesis protein DsbD, protein-disulfide reductase [Enhygromyxa salina]|uniref:Cytochrome c-type biogenesis protein DsbD, protein-disulfide reductase n=1 Tax=Enhygromyxa salina TaxID=215803 RepID=A0A0C2D900_9BACT|nr:protein-disulfide reductase DsbD domain-containing protein [Enhygromyxa salina]KIG16457.1 Cytochrome c-type biogenesis protein DsbD, protein-disulfide reductase [Enhygromyxa salina]
MHELVPALLAASLAACTTQTPTNAELPAEAAPAAGSGVGSKVGEKAPLVRVELALVDPAARARLATRLAAESGPEGPLANADALVAVRHEIEPGWHIYWQNPGESGLRTKLAITATHASAGAVLYPAPERFTSEGGQVTYGWSHEAVLFVPLTKLEAGASLELTSSYLACAQSCIPGSTTLTAKLDELPIASDPTTLAMLERVPEPAGERVAAAWADGKLTVTPRGELELAELFPLSTDTALLGKQVAAADALELHYRFTGSPPDGAQGVLRATLAGEPRWLELDVAWPESK